MTVWMLEDSWLAAAFEGEVVGRSGTKADTILEMLPVLLAASMARIAKYLWQKIFVLGDCCCCGLNVTRRLANGCPNCIKAMND